MGLKQWAITTASCSLMKSAEPDGKIAEAVELVNKWVTQTFPDNPSAIKYALVTYVVLPFAKILLKDDPSGFEKAKQEAKI